MAVTAADRAVSDREAHARLSHALHTAVLALCELERRYAAGQLDDLDHFEITARRNLATYRNLAPAATRHRARAARAPAVPDWQQRAAGDW
jgi:hypothetical protein